MPHKQILLLTCLMSLQANAMNMDNISLKKLRVGSAIVGALYLTSSVFKVKDDDRSKPVSLGQNLCDTIAVGAVTWQVAYGFIKRFNTAKEGKSTIYGSAALFVVIPFLMTEGYKYFRTDPGKKSIRLRDNLAISVVLMTSLIGLAYNEESA